MKTIIENVEKIDTKPAVKFTREQKKFVNFVSEKLILDAPAGSGKTETVAERVRVGVESGKKVMVACFTHAARKTMQRRLDEAGVFVQVRTVVSLAHELLVNEYGDGFDVGNGEEIARAVCAGTPVKWNQLLQLESLMANGAKLPKTLNAETAEVWEKYELAKADAFYFSFYDVVAGATGIGRLDCDELIIDEAQDLTPAQLKMLLSFGVKNIVLAGDPGQAIFGFAGVDTRLFEKLEKKGWDVLRLTKTFRVPANILPAVNATRSNEPLKAHRRGGKISTVAATYRELAEMIEPLLKPGDAVLGLNQIALNRFYNRVHEVRPDVPLSASWLDGEEDGSIFFSSIHSAKGGEWKRVFVIDVSTHGLWSFMDNEEEQLEKLFYVATTRAQREVVLCQIGEELPWGLGNND